MAKKSKKATSPRKAKKTGKAATSKKAKTPVTRPRTKSTASKEGMTAKSLQAPAKARRGKVAAQNQVIIPPPEIVDVNPKSFRDGDSPLIGASLTNFAASSIASACFVQTSVLANFTNPCVFTVFPSAQNPQIVRFPSTKFTYTGTTSTTAAITVTVTLKSGQLVSSKPVKVTYEPKP